LFAGGTGKAAPETDSPKNTIKPYKQMQTNLNSVQIVMNDTKRTTGLNFILKKASLTRIKKMQYSGGFKRFELDIYDDQAQYRHNQQTDDYQQVKAFIQFNCK